MSTQRGQSQFVELTRAALALRLLAVFIALLSPSGLAMTPLQITSIVVIVVMSILELRFPQYLSLLAVHPMFALADLAVVTGFVAVAGAPGALQLTVLTTAFLVGVWVDRIGGLISMTLLIALYFLGMDVQVRQDGATNLTMPFMLFALWILGLVMRKSIDDEMRSYKILQASLSAATAAQERAKLATELHDSLAKTIQSVALTTAIIPAAVESAPPRAIAAARQVHQMSTHAVAELREVMSGLTVVVRDTGNGFSEAGLRACQRAGHQGVLDVQRRLVRVGGLADVSSEVGRGTTVTMVVRDEPLEEHG